MSTTEPTAPAAEPQQESPGIFVAVQSILSADKEAKPADAIRQVMDRLGMSRNAVSEAYYRRRRELGALIVSKRPADAPTGNVDGANVVLPADKAAIKAYAQETGIDTKLVTDAFALFLVAREKERVRRTALGEDPNVPRQRQARTPSQPSPARTTGRGRQPQGRGMQARVVTQYVEAHDALMQHVAALESEVATYREAAKMFARAA